MVSELSINQKYTELSVI